MCLPRNLFSSYLICLAIILSVRTTTRPAFSTRVYRTLQTSEHTEASDPNVQFTHTHSEGGKLVEKENQEHVEPKHGTAEKVILKGKSRAFES